MVILGFCGKGNGALSQKSTMVEKAFLMLRLEGPASPRLELPMSTSMITVALMLEPVEDG